MCDLRLDVDLGPRRASNETHDAQYLIAEVLQPRRLDRQVNPRLVSLLVPGGDTFGAAIGGRGQECAEGRPYLGVRVE